MTQGGTRAGAARQLTTRLVEKVWGRTVLPDPFDVPEGNSIGEIWFEPPPEMDSLLVKYLFTSENLSVQVHPSQGNALAGEAGKEECWLVLDAEPGARLAIGFKEHQMPERVRDAARDGSIEDLLAWHEVAAGDIFYLPAGTVHAIGSGLSLVEVQQNSDTTFRLYDYGRPRDLHLDRAMAVARCEPYPACYRSRIAERGTTLIDGPYFRIDRIEGAPGEGVASLYPGALLVLPLAGEVVLSGEDGRTGPGECLYAPSFDALDFSDALETLLICPQ